MKHINNNIAVRLTSISKRYFIHHEKPTLIERIINGNNEEFWALKNINLTIKKGEKIGFVGPNGSGKTTLLKIIAGITSATSGEVVTQGKIVSLIDLEAGFHPDLTGIENIFLNGMLLGMKQNEIKRKLKSIIQFADIGQFMDVPLYTYSQGMKLRLGFSIAVNADPEILILDESLSAGDDSFQKKSLEKVQQFFKEGRTILVVSHWWEFIRKNCNRIIKLRHGEI